MDLLTALVTFATRLLGDRASAREGQRRKLPWKSTQKVSERAREIIESARAGQCSLESAIAFASERVPNLSLSKLEGIVAGTVEASYDEAKVLCETFGASIDYVWRGNGTPFSRSEECPPLVSEYLPLFREESVQEVTFVRGSKLPHAGFAIIKYDEFLYRVLPTMWHISSINGNGGANSLAELAQLSENVHRSGTHGVHVRGIEAPQEVVAEVFSGKLHPRSLFAKGWKVSHWWDDLADVDHRRACAHQYERLYDPEFLAAQAIIRSVQASRHTQSA